MKAQLDNLPIAGGMAPNTIAYVAPPIIGDMATNPLIFIWGAKIKEERQTMAGGRQPVLGTTGSASRVMTYFLDIYLQYAMANTNANQDNVFPLVIDTVMQQLRGIPIPNSIVDPIMSTWASSILEIGEEMNVEYAPVMETADQRFWTYQARIVTRVLERIQQ